MKTQTTITSKKGTKVNYSIIAEEGKFNVYVNNFSKPYKVSDYPAIMEEEDFYFVEDKDLQKELNKKGKIYLPFFNKNEIIEGLKKEIISENLTIKVSYMKNHGQFITEYNLDFNLSRKEAEEYKVSENDSAVWYEIPAKNLVVERKTTKTEDKIIVCVCCETEYSSNESILNHNGNCPKCKN